MGFRLTFKRILPPLPNSLVFCRTVLKFFSVSPLRVGSILVSAVRQVSDFGIGFSRWKFTYASPVFCFVFNLFLAALDLCCGSWPLGCCAQAFLVVRVGTTLYGSGAPASHGGGFSCAEWVLGLR